MSRPLSILLMPFLSLSPPFDCPVHLTCFRSTQDMHKVWKGGDTAKWKQKLRGGLFVTFTLSSWIPLISLALESFMQFCIKMCRQDTQKSPQETPLTSTSLRLSGLQTPARNRSYGILFLSDCKVAGIRVSPHYHVSSWVGSQQRCQIVP